MGGLVIAGVETPASLRFGLPPNLPLRTLPLRTLPLLKAAEGWGTRPTHRGEAAMNGAQRIVFSDEGSEKPDEWDTCPGLAFRARWRHGLSSRARPAR